MKFRFNGGRGAILCDKCGVILAEGNAIPEYVWDAVNKGKVKDLPGWCCEDNCERSLKALAETDRVMNKIREENRKVGK